MKQEKKLAIVAVVLGLVVGAAPSMAGAIKNWTSHETIRASDLNAVLNHIHTAAEAAIDSSSIEDGAVSSADISDGTIVNADVSASAAITGSKLNLTNDIVSGDIVNGTIVTEDLADGAITAPKMASLSTLPKVWATVDCGGASCTILDGYAVDSVTRNGTGDYTVDFTGTRLDAAYGTVVSSGSLGVVCRSDIAGRTTSVFVVLCADIGTGAAADGDFDFIMMDFT